MQAASGRPWARSRAPAKWASNAAPRSAPTKARSRSGRRPRPPFSNGLPSGRVKVRQRRRAILEALVGPKILLGANPDVALEPLEQIARVLRVVAARKAGHRRQNAHHVFVAVADAAAVI